MTSLNASEIANMREDLQTVQLSMKCTVERFTQSGVDPDGHPIGSWETLHEDLSCWYWEATYRNILQERDGPNVQVIEAYPRLIVPALTDITARDRIASITGVDGEVIKTNLNIRTLLNRLVDVLMFVESQT